MAVLVTRDDARRHFHVTAIGTLTIDDVNLVARLQQHDCRAYTLLFDARVATTVTSAELRQAAYRCRRMMVEQGRRGRCAVIVPEFLETITDHVYGIDLDCARIRERGRNSGRDFVTDLRPIEPAPHDRDRGRSRRDSKRRSTRPLGAVFRRASARGGWTVTLAVRRRAMTMPAATLCCYSGSTGISRIGNSALY